MTELLDCGKAMYICVKPEGTHMIKIYSNTCNKNENEILQSRKTHLDAHLNVTVGTVAGYNDSMLWGQLSCTNVHFSAELYF